MATSVEGIFRDGKVELLEPPQAGASEVRVVVAFPVMSEQVNLAALCGHD